MSEEENKNSENAESAPESEGDNANKPVKGPFTRLVTEERVTKLNLRDDPDGPRIIERVPSR